jgi:uridine kinase
MSRKRPFLIGIGGASCSGKTELANELASRLEAPVIALDSYYLDLAHMTVAERTRVNFDEPASMDYDLLRTQIARLKKGHAIDRPVYDFEKYTRSSAVEHVEPGAFVIIEGLFALHWADLRRLFGLRVYIEVPDDVSFERRSHRDVRERGRTPEAVLIQYNETVRPMASLYVVPTRRYADVIVNGEDPVAASTDAVLAFVNKATGESGTSK